MIPLIDFDSIMLYIVSNALQPLSISFLKYGKESKMVSMDTLVIKTENKFRSLITKQEYKKGDVICDIPTEKLFDKANRYTVQIGREQRPRPHGRRSRSPR